MSNTYVTPGSVVLEPRVIERIHQIHQYVDRMRAERVGYGPKAEAHVNDTVMSFFHGLDTLLQAQQVWIDGGAGYSFGGVLHGGIVFGMIARSGASTILGPDEEIHHFQHPALEFSFHS